MGDMERNQVFVIAVVIAALSLFGLKFFSGGSSIDEDPQFGSVTRHGDAGFDGDSGAQGDSGGRPRGQGSKGSGLSGHQSRLAAVSGSRTGADLSSGKPGSGHSAELIGGGDISRGGSVGTSASARTGRGAGGTANVAGGAGGSKLATGSLNVRDNDHANLVQQLAALPANPAQSGLGPDASLTPGQDVVLSVSHANDLQQSDLATDVKPKDDGVGINFTPDSVVAFPDAGNVRGDAGSISFDVKPQWNGADDTNNSFVQLRSENQWANRIEVVKNGQYLRFLVSDSGGVERDISLQIASWQPDESHSITATWGNMQTSFYVDGRLVGQTTMPNELQIAPGTPLYMGSKAFNYSGANATIENFKVYNRPLGLDEINHP